MGAAAMMTGEQYRASLNDGRRVYLAGKLVADVAGHPDFAIPVGTAAAAYDRFWRPGDDAVNPFLQAPTSAEALRTHGDIDADQLTRTTFTSLMTLLTAGDRIAGS